MTKITLSGGTTIELSTEQLRELGAKIAEAVEGKAEEAPEFNVGDYAVSTGVSQHGNIQRDYFVKVEETAVADFGYTLYVRHQKSRAAGYMRPQDLRHATAEEVAEYEKARIFTENGRKPNEYREGDIVRVICRKLSTAIYDGQITEVVTPDGTDEPEVRGRDGRTPYARVEPLVFVEQRLDRKQ